MKLYHQHNWPSTIEEATVIQQELKDKVITTDQLPDVKYVAGVDVGFEEDGTVTRAAIAVLTFPGLELVEQVLAKRPTHFPYVPGYLSFREVPAVLEALEQVKQLPDLLLCDGHGIAHPRRFGIACHIGVITGLPTIGVGKSILVGKHAELAEEKGHWQPLIHRKEIVGVALRTRSKYNPLYISPGHRISLQTAIDYVLKCAPKYRLPETTRRAHNLASQKV